MELIVETASFISLFSIIIWLYKKHNFSLTVLVLIEYLRFVVIVMLIKLTNKNQLHFLKLFIYIYAIFIVLTTFILYIQIGTVKRTNYLISSNTLS